MSIRGKVEERHWLGDDLVRELGDAGLCGLYVPERHGGQGLTQTGYARVFETFAQIDATLSIVMGVHQSIGFKGIHLFGTDEQKERLLPDLAAGRKLAGFALAEPKAGSDAYNLESRADRQPDGAWVLNGEKRYIGNGGMGSVVNSDSRWRLRARPGQDRLDGLLPVRAGVHVLPPIRSPTSMRRSRCCPASRASSRTRARSPRARSAISPRPSAPAPPAAFARA
jgi:hypothetical protein